jgi:NAD(P)H-dependent flavin oxidoreductase YrpB (nitropropane dioxygenase family)
VTGPDGVNMLDTRLTEKLGCKYPIVQTAMGWVADPNLVAGSCNAGGFGFLAGATIPADEIERDILRVRELTSQPFGVNFHMYQPNAADIVDLVIRHGVRAVSYSRSPGPEFIKKLKDAGVVCMPTVGLPKHALKAVELGADVVTVQGGEGGGHTGAIPTTLLIPQVIDAVGDKVPVVAAGGFKDGRGLVCRRHRHGNPLPHDHGESRAAGDPAALCRLYQPGGHHRLQGDGRIAPAHDYE